jgi:hypothetical protein
MHVEEEQPGIARRIWRFSGTFWMTLICLALLAPLVYRASQRAGMSHCWPAGAPLATGGGASNHVGYLVKTGRGTARPGEAALPGNRQYVMVENPLANDQVVAVAYYAYRNRATNDSPLSTVMEEIIVPDGPSPEIAATARAEYIALLKNSPDSFWRAVGARLAPGNLNDSLLSWRRLFDTLYLPTLVLGLIRSLAWTLPFLQILFDWMARQSPKSPEEVRRDKLARGLCPECGYSIIGLPRPKCPECGERLTP